MKLVVIGFILVTIVSCAKQDDISYVQIQEIPIIPPRLSASSTIIDSSITLTADLRLEGVEIYYTTDGSEPTNSSGRYTKPLTIKKHGTYSFKAYHPQWKASEVSTIKLYKKGHNPASIDWKTAPSDSYPGVGASTLKNHKKASLQFRDEQWQGFNSIANARVSFERNTFIEQITIGYLIDQNSWIFPPEEVTVRIAGEDPIQVAINSSEQIEGVILRDVSIPIGKELSSLIIEVKNTTLPEWHPGNGNAGWLFMDEWIFN